MVTENQRKCIISFLSGRMELSRGERVRIYRDFFRNSIGSTKDLEFSEANELCRSIKNQPDELEDKIADRLGWKRLF